MYRNSEEQLFARLEQIRGRAARLIHGDAAPPVPPLDDAANEALALAARVELRLPALAECFDLSPLAVEALVCLVAAEFDPFLRTVARALQRDVGRPWLELGTVAELLELAVPRVAELARLFAPGGPLRRAALVLVDDSHGAETPPVTTRVKVAGRIAQHLVGDDTLPEGLLLRRGGPHLADSLVATEIGERLVARLRRALLSGEPLVVEIAGADGTGRRYFAEAVAGEVGLPLLVAELGALEPRRLEERLAEAEREARLAGALLCLASWDSHLPGSSAAGGDEAGGPPPSSRTRRLPEIWSRFLAHQRGVVVVTAEEREPLLEQHAPTLAHVDVPFPTPSQRATLLARILERRGVPVEEHLDFEAVARRFALDPRRLEQAARAAYELARDRDLDNPAAPTVTPGDLVEACRHQLRHDLRSLASRVTASHRWEDLVIPVEVYHSLKEMIAYVRHAGRVYDEWGFGARHSLAQGVSALFAGPPGTGKTMCASVMARELDMELFRVDLSRVVSKWIGETEKNLGRVFDEAARSHAIILFDEADSLFAKRTEVKSSVDRYANLEVNYLLQRMEAFSGVTILTTNFEDTIDTAFKRRLTFRMRFEKPDAQARAALWRKVFPARAALAPGVDFDHLGQLFEMSGGSIRNAAVRAAFLAAAANQAIDMDQISLAAERESREMGLLTKAAPPRVTDEGDGPNDDEPEPPPSTPTPRRPRLIPVTHPRNR